MTSWTHPSSTTSTKPTQIAPLPGDAAVRDVDPGHQETPVGEGVMSRNNLHHQSNQPPTPAHNHQSTDHEHLQPLTTTIHKLTHLSHSSAGLKVIQLWTLVDVCLSARSSWILYPPEETYSETVHPASRAFFVISPMLEALPEFYWINLLLTSICLSVSLTSVWQI